MHLQVYDILKRLSFTEYEAKAYVALLKSDLPLSGYAAALQSGVPRSRIYDVLNSLEERGDIIASHESPVLYMPISPKELIARRKKSAEKTFTAAQQVFSNLENEKAQQRYIWSLKGREEIFQRLKKIIPCAKKQILLEIWPEDLTDLKDSLCQAARRGVKIIMVVYGKVDLPFAEVHEHYPIERDKEGGRWLVFGADAQEALAGIVSLGKECRAAWSSHPALVMPIVQMIIHDLCILEMLDKHRDILEKSFGKNLCDLRKKFYIGPVR